jgi:hypothetical protein
LRRRGHAQALADGIERERPHAGERHGHEIDAQLYLTPDAGELEDMSDADRVDLLAIVVVKYAEMEPQAKVAC